MKAILSLLCVLCVSACAQTLNVTTAFVGSINSAGGGGGGEPCSTPTPGTFNEGFETPTTYYEVAGWTLVAPATFPAPPGALTGGCTTAWFVTNTTAGALYLYNDAGAGYTQWSVRFSIWLDQIGTHAQYTSLLELDAAVANQRALCVYVRNLSGVPYLYVLGTTESAAITLSAGAWHTVDLKGDFPSGSVSVKVDGANEKTVTCYDATPRYIIFGPCYLSDAGLSCYYDAVSWKTNSNAYLP